MKFTLKRTLIGLGVTVIGYTLFSEFHNRNQIEKNKEALALLRRQAQNKPQEYENGGPVAKPLTTDMDLLAGTKGQIFNPLDLFRRKRLIVG